MVDETLQVLALKTWTFGSFAEVVLELAVGVSYLNEILRQRQPIVSGGLNLSYRCLHSSWKSPNVETELIGSRQ